MADRATDIQPTASQHIFADFKAVIKLPLGPGTQLRVGKCCPVTRLQDPPTGSRLSLRGNFITALKDGRAPSQQPANTILPTLEAVIKLPLGPGSGLRVGKCCPVTGLHDPPTGSCLSLRGNFITALKDGRAPSQQPTNTILPTLEAVIKLPLGPGTQLRVGKCCPVTGLQDPPTGSRLSLQGNFSTALKDG